MSDLAPPAAPSAPVPAQRVLTDPIKAGIRDAYAKLQANTPGFATRRVQSQMIGLVSRALATSGGIGIAEAPTGVGKSLGYLTAGVPIALATKKKLVISTGTVALQSQLVERDIPAFLKATGLEASVALAKGRAADPIGGHPNHVTKTATPVRRDGQAAGRVYASPPMDSEGPDLTA